MHFTPGQWPAETRVPRKYKAIADRVCTEAELDTLKLHMLNYSHRQIAITLHVTQRTISNRLASAVSKIRAAAEVDLDRFQLTPLATNSTSRARARAYGGKATHYDRGTIIRRDNGQCHLCHSYPPPSEISIDHLVPLSLGGDDTPENTAVACRRCNTQRGNRPLPPTSRYYASDPPATMTA